MEGAALEAPFLQDTWRWVGAHPATDNGGRGDWKNYPGNDYWSLHTSQGVLRIGSLEV